MKAFNSQRTVIWFASRLALGLVIAIAVIMTLSAMALLTKTLGIVPGWWDPACEWVLVNGFSFLAAITILVSVYGILNYSLKNSLAARYPQPKHETLEFARNLKTRGDVMHHFEQKDPAAQARRNVRV